MDDKQSVTAELLARFQYAEGYRQDYDARALEYYRLFKGYRDPLPVVWLSAKKSAMYQIRL